jgi:N-acetylglutamate synthase-like GNAT family acetyltransferase
MVDGPGRRKTGNAEFLSKSGPWLDGLGRLRTARRGITLLGGAAAWPIAPIRVLGYQSKDPIRALLQGRVKCTILTTVQTLNVQWWRLKPMKCDMAEITISVLADDEAARIVALWQYTEWGSGYEGMLFEHFLSDVKKAIGSHSIPLVFVAMIDNEVIGTASIIENDLPSRNDLNPWLASIFVRKDWRKKGIASALILEAIRHASHLTLGKLFLFTHDRQEFYSQFWFNQVDCTQFMGKKVSIMMRDLVA